MKGNVVSAPAGATELFHHPHGAVRVKAVHQNGGGALQFGTSGQEGGNGVAGPFIVMLLRTIVFGLQVVIQKDRVVSSSLQQFLRFGDLARDVELVALKSPGEPFAPPSIILKQK